ncbi:PucR family transcriptional regulator [Kitasatospora cheerisanensis]|uniref:Transcriptional activator protein n=1 Tax=Kitasatospora cheerisanensis KCTC 2395 TaxID=1348663 RepID=A0A066Z6Y4_9ACTN|nr:PucR family transcriptional regulator [Kitasatospora cheerisanensis]KDN86086.1 transcriptional activator protein [Kitasatospora cheerisanensis KCTC 2395]
MPPPPPRILELIRRGAEIALNPQPEWLAELDAATLAGETRRPIADDPVLSAGLRRVNRANLLRWAAANATAPGVPVPAPEGDEQRLMARDIVRRGLDEPALDSYRAGESVAGRLWTRIACSLTTDPEELRDLLDVSLRSISAFVDGCVAAMSADLRAERAALTGSNHADRMQAVALLLDGAPIARARAEARLGYPLAGSHTAAVLWVDDLDSDFAQLDRAADLLASAAGRPPILDVTASAATRWLWTAARPDPAALRAGLDRLPAVRIALGPTAAGVNGFRRSHLDALTTQRMLARLASVQRLASHDEVELVALLTQDLEGADRFVRRVLGPLDGPPAEAVRAYLAEQCNATRAAARLFTHRNTLLRRLAQADAVLPRPLTENPLEVAAALELRHWRGQD